MEFNKEQLSGRGQRHWKHTPQSTGRGLARHGPGSRQNRLLYIAIGLLCAVLFRDLWVNGIINTKALVMNPEAATRVEIPDELYLMGEARRFVKDVDGFQNKVKEIAQMLDVPPEWLMAVMYSESKFDAGVKNHRGSGATGLIQFMPSTATELNVSLDRLQRMSHLQQLEYVYLYLQTVRDRYGDFSSLTDLYLAILYPKARKKDYCYSLYTKPSKRYHQNSGLDENGDGSVTVSDIDRRMRRLYPRAYAATQ